MPTSLTVAADEWESRRVQLLENLKRTIQPLVLEILGEDLAVNAFLDGLLPFLKRSISMEVEDLLADSFRNWSFRYEVNHYLYHWLEDNRSSLADLVGNQFDIEAVETSLTSRLAAFEERIRALEIGQDGEDLRHSRDGPNRSSPGSRHHRRAGAPYPRPILVPH